MKRKPLSMARGMSRLCARWIAGCIVALPGMALLASASANAQTFVPTFGQTPAPDYVRFGSQPSQTSAGSSPIAPTGLAPGLYVQVIDGLVTLSNPAGAQVFQAGQFGFNPSYAVPPVVIPQNPGLLFTPPVSFSPPAPQTPMPPAPSGPMVTQTPTPVVTPPITPPVVLANGTNYYMMNWGSDGLANLGIGAGVFNSANALTKFTGTTVPFNVVSGVTATDTGALEDLGWGRWTAGKVADHGITFDLSTWNAGMPYVIGRPTLDANLPVSGTMTYALAGATKAIDMTTGAVGTLSGSLSIAFQNAQYAVTPNLNIAMSAGPTYVTGAGSTTVGPDGARATFSTTTQNVTGGACAGGCRFSTQGVLTGAAANNAGIVYSLTGPDVRVVGAAGFKR
ncbi:hypothetical protein PAQ31011_03505 [Pandoraea aquatica]|uniref:Transferrin-binding protein B C-lobe/N-lobe beta barrel domain-containing protein n=1 Tax=Pandoraea aquatica TaxID=2508290 RepID=A0A5E4WTG1_9BURK|nr:hypothetical protein [Pandoraea aquatica]VVE27801.1 hypothetical protein PAQ31011_03505 [Pandoraea aquatica]